MLLFEDLRRSGFKVREHFIGSNLKAQLDEAEKVQAKFTLILGQKELLDGTILLKDMESGIQETINMKKLINELDKRLHIG
jgi:histidyl-tRNA synthetase